MGMDAGDRAVTPPIRLLIADDQDLIRDALEALLAREPTVEVVAVARDGHQAVSEAQRVHPDVVMMDVRMSEADGAAATAAIRSHPDLAATRVVILSTFEDDDVVAACMRAGADGFISKGTTPEALIDAIHKVHRGDPALSPHAARALLRNLVESGQATRPPDHRLVSLTPREREIVGHVGLGWSNERIARALSISPATAKTHVNNAMAKLHVHDRAGPSPSRTSCIWSEPSTASAVEGIPRLDVLPDTLRQLTGGARLPCLRQGHRATDGVVGCSRPKGGFCPCPHSFGTAGGWRQQRDAPHCWPARSSEPESHRHPLRQQA